MFKLKHYWLIGEVHVPVVSINPPTSRTFLAPNWTSVCVASAVQLAIVTTSLVFKSAQVSTHMIVWLWPILSSYCTIQNQKHLLRWIGILKVHWTRRSVDMISIENVLQHDDTCTVYVCNCFLTYANTSMHHCQDVMYMCIPNLFFSHLCNIFVSQILMSPTCSCCCLFGIVLLL